MKKSNYDRWVLVTGCGTGIGRFTSEYLAMNGFSVYASARKEKDLNALGKIKHITPVRLDVTKDDEIAAVVERIKKEGTGLYGLVNNAGIIKGGPLAVLPDGYLEELFETNFFGMHKLTKALFPMIHQSNGRIVIVGSVMGFIAYPFVGPYCASKHAIEAYADCLRRELFLTRVKVSLIQPGYVRSALWEKSANEFVDTTELLQKSLWKPYKDICIDFFQKFLDGSGKNCTSLTRVANAVFNGLTKRSPRNRYLVTERRIKYWMIQLLPGFALDLYFKYLYKTCRKRRSLSMKSF